MMLQKERKNYRLEWFIKQRLFLYKYIWFEGIQPNLYNKNILPSILVIGLDIFKLS